MTKEMWDRAARSFDDEPDHGLTDPQVRAAWRELLLDVLPAAPARIADIGCGTGTLTRLLTDDGFVVDGVDFSEEMLRLARRKVPKAHFLLADAADPGLDDHTYDVVLSRHVLWTLPDPDAAARNWVRLLKPDGIIVLIEGRWNAGVGLTADQATAIVETVRPEVRIRPMPESIYWGKNINDERYLLVGAPKH